MKRMLGIVLALLAIVSAASAASVPYTLVGKIFPTLKNPAAKGDFAAHMLLFDGAVGGHMDIIYNNGHDPLAYDFSLVANIPGPPDQRFYSGGGGKQSILLADFDGGAASIFTNAGWDDASGNAGWDVFSMTWDIADPTVPILNGSVSSIMEGTLPLEDLLPSIPVTEPAAGGLAVLGLVALGVFVRSTRI